MGSRRVWAQEGWTLCWGLKMKEDIWLAVQLGSGICDNKQGNGDLSLQPQSAKFCPFSCRASRWAQLAWESLLWYLSRGPSHASPDIRATETRNPWSGVISVQLVTGIENESIAHSFLVREINASLLSQAAQYYLSCYYFDSANYIQAHPYFQNYTCRCFLLFSIPIK